MVTKKLNKYERCRLLAARAGELVEGDKPNVKIDESKPQLARDCNETAERELEEGTLELEIYHSKSK
ncbi:MAG: DNA-directed RNA polymerase subunit omega [Nanoarchaeales archaeon]|nr:DNA-directed RNA polymerase subunit omega [Nanoarchaeales archaeon]